MLPECDRETTTAWAVRENCYRPAMNRKVERPGVREGYDLWAETYDRTPNPVVALDRRHALTHLRPRAGERVLDAGCGTGANLRAIAGAGAEPVGLDFSLGMLRTAQRAAPEAMLAQADLNSQFPLRRSTFDALLCSLVSEHLTDLTTFFGEALAVLKRGGRFVFSAFHPELARAGIEANFEQDGVEYRLGAEPHSIDDFLNRMDDAGFRDIRACDYVPDDALVEEIPWAVKYLGRPLLLMVDAARP
jgi:ubiquinone/menaquinone biosynthesis C-methylase UbiE